MRRPIGHAEWRDGIGVCRAVFGGDSICTRLPGHRGNHAALTMEERVDEAHDVALVIAASRRMQAEDEARKAAIIAAGCHHPDQDSLFIGAVELGDRVSVRGVEYVTCRICGARLR